MYTIEKILRFHTDRWSQVTRNPNFVFLFRWNDESSSKEIIRSSWFEISSLSTTTYSVWKSTIEYLFFTSWTSIRNDLFQYSWKTIHQRKSSRIETTDYSSEFNSTSRFSTTDRQSSRTTANINRSNSRTNE